MSGAGFVARDLYAADPHNYAPGMHDVVLTLGDGRMRQSDDVFESRYEADAAIVRLDDMPPEDLAVWGSPLAAAR